MRRLVYAILWTLILSSAISRAEAKKVWVVQNGQPKLSIRAGSVPAPIDELRHYLKRMTGAEIPAAPGDARSGILFVGLFKDFPDLGLKKPKDLGEEGFLLRSEAGNLYLLADRPLGVQHAVTTFLHQLGCRWFFPGTTWEVVPRQKDIAGSWDEIQRPAFSMQRRIWPGYGSYRQNKVDWQNWDRHNRMGGPVDIAIGHTFNGLNPDKDFAEHPEWFALVNGKRQPTKPCYAHPEVVKRAIAYALAKAESGDKMISMSAPDGLGYCECERCMAVLRGTTTFRAHGTLFGKKPNGEIINITSETLFGLINKTAEAVAKKYPDVRIGCYAYSAYSHPPSFDFHPNVYIQTTTRYRRTPLTMEEQLAQFGKKTKHLGIREYYSVYQWDWDGPDPGQVRPDRLQQSLSFFQKHGVTAINAEASNNWGPRGLGYYLASQMMWRGTDIDLKPIIRDFYEKAFGPAALPMQRYYVRWYGSSAVAIDDPALRIPKDDEKPTLTADSLKAAIRDLDEAVRLTKDDPECRRRVDHLRMYVHFLVLRHRLDVAAAQKDKEAILDGIKGETVFGGRLNDTNLVHARPLIGKAFLRRFRKHVPILESLPESNREAKAWRKLGQPPDAKELEQLWRADKAFLSKPASIR
ncbi:MAG: hypothetical protein KatS3mg105_2348 [Gemmatales bacterium]|nr:MAG: hypothetical protein KatS3mg105_2348 [Gemmatales bacterium]